MPSDLRRSLGHIDVELERGYLEYSRKPDVLQPDFMPEAFDSRWYLNHTRSESYRTKQDVRIPCDSQC